MNKYIIVTVGIVLLLILGGTGPFAFAETPPGMEKIKVGSTEYVVPEGTKIKERNGKTSLETSMAYNARRFFELDQRLDKLEEKMETFGGDDGKLSRQLDRIKRSINRLQEELDELQAEFTYIKTKH